MDTWQKKYSAGCEWCGTKIPAIKAKGKNGWDTHGLESAHIIAREFAPEHEWNVFILCPTCHKIFDEVIKPRVQRALEIAVTGYPNPPTAKQRDYVSARDYKEAVERLSKPQNGPSISLNPPAISKTVWNERQTQNKTEPNKAMEPTPVSVTIPAAQEVAPLTSVAHL